MNTFKKHLAYAATAAVTVSATAAYAVDFTANATLQNTLAVQNLQDFDIGTVFATETGATLAAGVGALVISPEGVTDSTVADSATVNLTNLTAATPGQGSVDMAAEFTLTLPDTSAIDAADFTDNTTSTSLVAITDGSGNATELVHETANPAVPSLWLMHFTVGDVSGGVAAEDNAGSNDGLYTVTPDFGETTYVFNIGATITTEPTTGAETYQEGIYSGTFEITAAY